MNFSQLSLLRWSMALLMILAQLAATPADAEDEFTSDFDRDRCNFSSTGSNPYFPLWPGYSTSYEGEEEDDEGEMVEIGLTINVLSDTEFVDGVWTRVLEEVETEDGELVEISRNFVAVCRETGDVWYFGEDVDDYEDGEIVGHGGEWRAGINGAVPGILMPGTPILGARFMEEIAPGVAEDRGEIIGMGAEVVVPAGTFTHTLTIEDSDALDPEAEGDVKHYAAGVGLIQDEALELIEIELPACLPDATTHCLSDGRFEVTATWRDTDNNNGDGVAIVPSSDSGEFWFFSPNNTELLVKVLDACDLDGSDHFWVFAGGLTDVDVTITITDTQTNLMREYGNDLGTPFEPVVDLQAFATCP